MMELYNYNHALPVQRQPPSTLKPSKFPVPDLSTLLCRRSLAGIPRAYFVRAHSDSSAASAAELLDKRTPEQPGGKMVAELVGAFKEVTERMSMNMLSTSSSRILFKTLKLSIPILQFLPLTQDGRSPLSKALSVAVMLADLQVGIETRKTARNY